MSKIILYTQVYENYADDCDLSPGYWKAKGGAEYVVKNIDVNRANDIIVAASAKVEHDSNVYRETVISAEVVADDYLTEFERQQLNWDGRIDYHPQEIAV